MKEDNTGDLKRSQLRPRASLPRPLATCAAIAALAACAPAPALEADAAAVAPVRPGVEVLLGDSIHLVRGFRVGLVTNHTGVLHYDPEPPDAARSTIDLLHEHPAIELVALFSPEHGIRGEAEAGVRVADDVDRRTGLPIHSLYGETRKPTARMLDGFDALLFDIQDIGTRYYTYVWTMTLAMEAAAEHGLRFIVLDRPNPIGAQVQGNVLDPRFATFVGLYPVPMRHGLTAGEIARYVNAEHGIAAELHVVPAAGWRRHTWFEDTGLAWRPPSPNMPSVESATHYPGTCLFEGTNLSVGRGTDRAFQQIGAPWLDHAELVQRLDGYRIPGVRFEAVDFTPRDPGDGRFGGERVRGVRLHVTDRDVYDPTLAGIALLVEIRRLHPDRLQWHVSHFDRLAGTDQVRKQILAGRSVTEITREWPAQIAAFRAAVAPYLLYE